MQANKSNLVKRSTKGSELTYAELDGNTTELSKLIDDVSANVQSIDALNTQATQNTQAHIDINQNVATLSNTVGGLLTSKQDSVLQIANKTAAYTVVASDKNTIINCTAGIFTVTLTAAATLGSGFSCWIWNTSNTATDIITIDPNLSETIDGLTTLSVRRGEGVQIVCDGSNIQTGNKKAMRSYSENFAYSTSRPSASSHLAIAIGAGASSSATAALTFGFSTVASASYATAIGGNSAGGGSQAVTGAGAMALGGSYASGTDSFAAAIGDNTSTYGSTGSGSVSIGYHAKASGINSTAIGGFAPVASNQYSVCIGGLANNSTGVSSCIVGGQSNIATGSFSCIVGGQSNIATGSYAVANGYFASSPLYGKSTFASGKFTNTGDAQTGTMVLRRQTTDATTTILTSDGSSASTTQVVLADNTTYSFKILVTAMQKASDGTNSAGYEFVGVIRRGTGAASVVLKGSTKSVLYEDDATWDCTIAANTTSGGLSVSVIGAAATNIAWVATVLSTEVTYA